MSSAILARKAEVSTADCMVRMEENGGRKRGGGRDQTRPDHGLERR